MALAPSPLETIAYFSATSLVWSDDELAELLKISQVNNQLMNVSGFLIYADGSFLQWLEGPSESVNAVFEKILLDSRHSNISPIFRGSLGERYFPQWSMAFIPKSDFSEELSHELVDLRVLRHGGGFLTDAPRLAKRVADNFLRFNRF